MPHTLAEIAKRIGARLVGPDARVTGVATLSDAGPGDLALCSDRRRIDQLKSTRAGGVLIPARAKVLLEAAPCPVLEVDKPRESLAQVLAIFHPDRKVEPGIDPGALVHSDARVDSMARVDRGAQIGARSSVGARTRVEANAVIGSDVVIGEDCRISANATILEGSVLGDRVFVGPGAVIGSAGFGFVSDQDGHRRMPQVGKVVIGSDVEIGANTTVDRGTLGATRIGRGSKLDNLVQVGHNVQIGERVIIAAQVGLSGSVTIGDGAVLGGQVGVADHISIGAGAQVGAKSGVGSHVPPGARVAGYPAMDVGQWLKSVFLWRRLQRGKNSPSREDDR